MYRASLLMAVALMVGGCVPQGTLKTLVYIKDVGCIVTTPEGRAAVREKQSIPTNICGDDLNGQAD